MTMHPKQHLAFLPKIYKARGIDHIVISPGSRNAPLIQVFYREFGANCHSLVDERSAAYFATGMALKTKKPVVLISTSGTAMLNFSPALAEAFYQGVPLIAITADRPPEWIGQEDNQAIRQRNVYGQNIKKSFELPVHAFGHEDLWYTERLINESYNIANTGKKGPVHINVPLREPLYDKVPDVQKVNVIDFICSGQLVLPSPMEKEYLNAQKILLVIGQRNKNKDFDINLQRLLEDKRICITAESIANLEEVPEVVNADIVLATQYGIKDSLIPDLVIYLGGQVVSKRLKQFLRTNSVPVQWRVSQDGDHIDTFQHVSRIIHSGDNSLIKTILRLKPDIKSSYQEEWRSAYKSSKSLLTKVLEDVEYSDLYAMEKISGILTPDDIIFIGNSSIIRYYQLFPGKANEVYANRGTSGIDGSVSTAAGIAACTDRNVYLLVGDLSFVYDSNGLWNNDLPSNLKIVVINNNGGGIFSLIDGPMQQDSFDKFFATRHKVNISKISEAFGLMYFFSSSANELDNILPYFKDYSKACLLEVRTPEDLNPSIFRNFISNLKQ